MVLLHAAEGSLMKENTSQYRGKSLFHSTFPAQPWSSAVLSTVIGLGGLSPGQRRYGWFSAEISSGFHILPPYYICQYVVGFVPHQNLHPSAEAVGWTTSWDTLVSQQTPCTVFFRNDNKSLWTHSMFRTSWGGGGNVRVCSSHCQCYKKESLW